MVSPLLRSGLFDRHGFRHGFTLRTGGCSAPPFATLNLARHVGDDPVAVQSNHVRVAGWVGFPPDRLFEVSQVHGSDVEVASADGSPDELRAREADAIVGLAGVRPVAVGVRVADCIPLLLADPRTGAVAAVHAGWRGVVARVVEAAIDALEREAGTDRADVLAVVGPHIRADAFEVGEDVAARIAGEAHGAAVVRHGHDKPRVDLAAVVVAQLSHLGIAPERIDDVGGCTFQEADRFFSYRRDGSRSGRHLGVIVARGRALL